MAPDQKTTPPFNSFNLLNTPYLISGQIYSTLLSSDELKNGAIKMRKNILALFVISLLGTSSAFAQKRVSLNRNFNEPKGMIELCENHLLYSNSTYEDRDCMVGKDDSNGNFKISYFESNGYKSIVAFFKDDLSKRCEKFGYRRAYYVETKLKTSYENSRAAAFLSLNPTEFNSLNTDQIAELSNMECVK
jgi:hypothetical protein